MINKQQFTNGRTYEIEPKSLFLWGYNDVGQLGLGDKIARSSPVQVGSSSSWKDISRISGGNTSAVLSE